MQVNRMDVNAVTLLAENRGPESIALLQNALSLNAQNPFTLNDLGVAYETIGDYENALKSYDAVAEMHSSERVVVTLDRTWRGKPVSVMAAASSRRLRDRMNKMDSAKLNAVLLTMHGVSATNRNDWLEARKDFLHAYSIDPGGAFSLNNRGYVAEMDGDLETAQFFYGKARKASDANARIGLATQHLAEGKKLSIVATDSSHEVNGELDIYSQERRRETGPIELIPRNSAPAADSSVPPEVPSSSGARRAPVPFHTQPN
jgi:tetratricopeptide (TPR) repeat protein